MCYDERKDSNMRCFMGILVCVFLAVSSQLLLKIGVINSWSKDSFLLYNYIKLLLNPVVLLGGFLYLGSSILWVLILQRRNLSYVYPIVSLGYVLVVIASCFILGENISLLRWTGVGIICIGVSLDAQS